MMPARLLLLAGILGIVVLAGMRLIASDRRSAPPRHARSWFTDVAVTAGLTFRHENAQTGRWFFPESNGSGCAFFDADGDGWMDVLMVNGGRLPGYEPPQVPTMRLYMNRQGRFTDATAGSGLDVEQYGTGVCAGDFDNDGKTDLYVAGYRQGRLFRNLGGGRFADITNTAGVGNEGRWGTACAWFDYDKDGRLDLFVGNYIRYRLGSDTPCLRSEGFLSYCGPRWFKPDSPRLYRNEGLGRFRDVSGAAGLARVQTKALAVAVFDYDRDGWDDIFVANDVFPNNLLRNRGGARFEDAALAAGVAFPDTGEPMAGMGADFWDRNGDGRLWLAVSNFSGFGLALFRQPEPGGPFTDDSFATGTAQVSKRYLGFGLTWIDTDNSGDRQLFVANGHVHPEIQRHRPEYTYAEPKQLLAYSPDGRVRDVTNQAGTALTTPTVARGLALGDFDNDGRLDVLINNLNQPAQLLRNTRATGNEWVGFLLEGRRGNRDGIGARVTVTAPGLRRVDWRRSGGSYVSSSDPRLHFGLGSHGGPVDVRIEWPRGHTEIVRGVNPGSYYRIVEGSGAATPLPAIG
jgi:enediyne biosynthesis protein E4